MMKVSSSNNHFWDSCTLIRLITKTPAELLGDMSKILDEARAGKRKVWISTLLFAEFRPSLLKPDSRFRSIDDLVSDIEGVLVPITPNIDISQRAARLRDHLFRLPDGERQATEKDSVLTVPDAIHLATCLFLKETLGIGDIEFHTFDNGKGRNYEGKGVSLLQFERYSTHIAGNSDIEAVKKLVRIKPALDMANLV